jgi:hypothetical protein
MFEIVGEYLKLMGDPRKVTQTGQPVYFGGTVSNEALVPHGAVKLGSVNFDQWMSRQEVRK